MSHSLRGPIPNLDRLYADPAGTLAKEEIRIAPDGKRGLFIGVVLLALLALLIMRYKMRLALPWRTHAAIMAAVVGIGFPLVALCPFGVELVLTAEGLRLRRRATEVFCPWSLFHASGTFFVRGTELVLPIAARAIPFIRQYHHEGLVRQGVQLRTALLELQHGTQAALLNQSQAPSDQLGPLLLHLGRTLGGRLPAESTLAEASPAPEGGDPRLRAGKKGGWITLPLTGLVFPPFCCDCGLAAETSLPLDVGRHVLWDVVSILGHYDMKVRVAIPSCHHCLEATKRRQRQGRWTGAAIGLLLGLVATFAVVAFRPVADPVGSWIIGGGVTLFGSWIGFDTGAAYVRFPVQAYYSARAHTLALRFRRSDYADAVRAFSGVDVHSGNGEGMKR